MKKILLVDLCTWLGHHETYFMKILSILSTNGYQVYASCTENNNLRKNLKALNLDHVSVVETNLTLVDKVLIKLLEILDKIIISFPFTTPVRLSSLTTLVVTKRLIAQIGEEIPVFFVYADNVIPAVPLWISKRFLPASWVGLYMQPSYQAHVAWGKEETRRRFFAEKVFSLPSCKTILVLHPIYQRFFRLRFGKLSIITLPELVDTELADEDEFIYTIRNRANGRKIIALCGSLMRKRNLLLFLQACCHLNREHYFCLVVGLMDESIYPAEEMKQIRQCIEVLASNSYIQTDLYIASERLLNRLLALSDAVFVHYKDHPFSSNMLIKAMALRKPVIASNGYLIERTVCAYGWPGLAEDEPEQMALVIQQIINAPISESSYQHIMADHSTQRFAQAVIETCNHVFCR